MRLKAIGLRTAWIKGFMLTLTALLILLTFATSHQRRDALVHLHQASDELSRLNAASDFLTDAVRSYAVSGDDRYREEFLREKDRLRNRDHAVERLLALGLEPDEAARVRSAKSRSDALLELEARIFEAGALGNRPQALALAYGESYLVAKRGIRRDIGLADEQIHQRLMRYTARLDTRVDRLTIAAVAMMALTLILIAVTQFRFYQRRLLDPLAALTAATCRLLAGERGVSFPHAGDDTEIGDLSRALASYQQAMTDLDGQRQALAMAESWYRHIIECAPDAILVTGPDGLILQANPKADEVFGHARGGLVGLPVAALLPQEAIPAGHGGAADVGDAGPFSGEFRGRTRDGLSLPLEISFTPMPRHAHYGVCFCFVVRDLTQRKQFEQMMA